MPNSAANFAGKTPPPLVVLFGLHEVIPLKEKATGKTKNRGHGVGGCKEEGGRTIISPSNDSITRERASEQPNSPNYSYPKVAS